MSDINFDLSLAPNITDFPNSEQLFLNLNSDFRLEGENYEIWHSQNLQIDFQPNFNYEADLTWSIIGDQAASEGGGNSGEKQTSNCTNWSENYPEKVFKITKGGRVNSDKNMNKRPFKKRPKTNRNLRKVTCFTDRKRFTKEHDRGK